MRELQTDAEWDIVEGDPCWVSEFVPTASVVDGEVVAPNLTEPYAAVILVSPRLSLLTKGYITHKVDFQHLWEAFRERGVGEDEEVIIFWTTKHLKSYAKPVSMVMPKLWVMVCPKGAYELMADSSYQPELTGEAFRCAMGRDSACNEIERICSNHSKIKDKRQHPRTSSTNPSGARGESR